MAKSKKREYAIHTADGFLAGYIEAESPSRAIGEALTAWPDLSRREVSHPLSASPVVVAGTSKRRATKRKRAGAKKRTVTRLRVATKRRRGYGVMRHGASTPSRVLAKNSYSAGPYSEYGPAHEKALRIESAGGRGMRIDKRRGGWYVSYVSPEALH